MNRRANRQFTPMKEIMLGMSGYMVINVKVMKILGLETTVFLSTLAEAENMLADEEGWFYQTADTVESITGLSRYKQDKAIEELERLGILIKEVRGIPPKRFFKLFYKELEELIANGLQIKTQTACKSNPKILETNTEDNNTEDTNTEDKIHSAIQDKPESNIPLDSRDDTKPDPIHEHVVKHLNEATGSRYRSNTEGTKRLIRARQNEGFTLDDFKVVIDKKTADWKGTDMEQYLRPQTLFGTKFESYLNQQGTGRKTFQRGGYQPRALPETYADDPDDFAKWFEDEA